MSIRISTAVWTSSPRKGSELLMLLALADYANDQGSCYPSVRTLARRCRITSRHANRILANLLEGGEIEVQRNAGRGWANVYVIRMDRLACGASRGGVAVAHGCERSDDTGSVSRDSVAASAEPTGDPHTPETSINPVAPIAGEVPSGQAQIDANADGGVFAHFWPDEWS